MYLSILYNIYIERNFLLVLGEAPGDFPVIDRFLPDPVDCALGFLFSSWFPLEVWYPTGLLLTPSPFSHANDARDGSLPDRRREDARTFARGGDIFREASSALCELVPEAELARGLMMPELPPFKSTSDLHLPTP